MDWRNVGVKMWIVITLDGIEWAFVRSEAKEKERKVEGELFHLSVTYRYFCSQLKSGIFLCFADRASQYDLSN